MNPVWLIFIALVIGALPAIVRGLYPPLFFRRGVPVHPQAVVVLGAGHRQRRGRYVTGVVGLRRVQLGLMQAQQRQLPLLLCGGRKSLRDAVPSEASLMAQEVRWRAASQSLWLEEKSRNTWENATYAAELLRQHGVSRIVLVTDRPHMSRALMCFKAQGLEVEPVALDQLPASNWVPTAAALFLIPEIWYEWLALAWYALRWGWR